MKSIADRIDALSEGGGSRRKKMLRQTAADDAIPGLPTEKEIVRSPREHGARAAMPMPVGWSKNKRIEHPAHTRARLGREARADDHDELAGRHPGHMVRELKKKRDHSDMMAFVSGKTKLGESQMSLGDLVIECRSLIEGGGSRASKAERQVSLRVHQGIAAGIYKPGMHTPETMRRFARERGPLGVAAERRGPVDEGGGSRRSKFKRQAAEIGDYSGLKSDQVPSSRDDMLAAAGTPKFSKFRDSRVKLRMRRTPGKETW